MADEDLDLLISLDLQQISCPSVMLKAEQSACIKSVDDGNNLFLCLPTRFGKSFVTKYCHLLLATSTTSKTVVSDLGLKRAGGGGRMSLISTACTCDI